MNEKAVKYLCWNFYIELPKSDEGAVINQNSSTIILFLLYEFFSYWLQLHPSYLSRRGIAMPPILHASYDPCLFALYFSWRVKEALLNKAQAKLALSNHWKLSLTVFKFVTLNDCSGTKKLLRITDYDS